MAQLFFAFILPSLLVLLKSFDLNLNDSESVISYHLVHLCKIDINCQMFLNNYRYIVLNYI